MIRRLDIFLAFVGRAHDFVTRLVAAVYPPSVPPDGGRQRQAFVSSARGVLGVEILGLTVVRLRVGYGERGWVATLQSEAF